MQNNALNWPTNSIIVGDDAFPLRSNLMKPYSKRKLSVREKIFNYRLSRARRVAENAFGILASRFRIFFRPIDFLPGTTDLIIKSACHLHNWLIATSTITYLQSGSVDQEDINVGQINFGEWRNSNVSLQSVGQVSSNNYSEEASRKREEYADFFLHGGAVPWQMQSIGAQ